MEILINQDKTFLKQIPHLPGVYRFYTIGGAKQELLYVGKAINLYKRVKSYFQKTSSRSPRISRMVDQIGRIEITITENEASALILENNLIKSLKPKYNIIFRDDKGYPLIRVSSHKFPKIDIYRGKTGRSSNEYFGPYPNVAAVTQAINLIQKLFKLRSCTDSVFKNRTRPCILHQIKLCTAPCVKYVSEEEYKLQVAMAMEFLRGNYTQVVNEFTKEMHEKAEKMEFEAAANIRDKINMLNSISKNQFISNHNQPLTADVIVARAFNDKVCIYVICVQNGIYSGDRNFILNNPNSDIIEVISAFLQGHYLDHQNVSMVYLDILSNDGNLVWPDNEFLQMFYAATKIRVMPIKSKMIKKISNMAKINLERIVKSANQTNELELAAKELATLLQIDEINRIECVDISHHHGSNAVASCVVYQDGKINNSLYRRYNLPNSIGGDDLLGMKTMLERRFKATDIPLPEVILIDGGITQYNMLKNLIVTNGLCDKIRAVSIFKGERRNPEYDQVIIESHKILRYKDNQTLFKLLQSLRDEAHRFAITGHRRAQVKKMAISKLEDIPNIGAVKRASLLTHFGGIRGVMQASIDELQQVNGISLTLAQKIFAYFHNE